MLVSLSPVPDGSVSANENGKTEVLIAEGIKFKSS